MPQNQLINHIMIPMDTIYVFLLFQMVSDPKTRATDWKESQMNYCFHKLDGAIPDMEAHFN